MQDCSKQLASYYCTFLKFSNHLFPFKLVNLCGEQQREINCASYTFAAPGPVNNLQMTTPTATTLTITWTVSGSIDQFEVTYSLTVNVSAPRTDTISDGSMRSYTLINLNENSNYTITVIAINTAGSTMATITADTPPSGNQFYIGYHAYCFSCLQTAPSAWHS